MKDVPLGDQVGQNRAEAVDEVGRAKILLIHRIELGPRRDHRKEIILARTSLLPSDPLLQILRTGLLDAIPVIFERLLLVANQGKPIVLLPTGNPEKHQSW